MSTTQQLNQTFCALLVDHVLAMETDAYFSGHPEWQYIVLNAKQAIGQTTPITRTDKLIAVMRGDYRAWCTANKFEFMSADELLFDQRDNLTDEQKKYLKEFIELWDIVTAN